MYTTPSPRKKSNRPHKISPSSKKVDSIHERHRRIDKNFALIYNKLFNTLFDKNDRIYMKEVLTDDLIIEQFIHVDLEDSPEYEMADDDTKQYIYAFQKIMKYVYKLLIERQKKKNYPIRILSSTSKNFLENIPISDSLRKRISEDLKNYLKSKEMLLNYIISLKLADDPINEDLEEFYDAFYPYFECTPWESL